MTSKHKTDPDGIHENDLYDVDVNDDVDDEDADIEMKLIDKPSPNESNNDGNENILESVKIELNRNKPERSNRGFIMGLAVGLTIAFASVAVFAVLNAPENPMFTHDQNTTTTQIAVVSPPDDVSEKSSPSHKGNVWDDWETNRDLEEMIRKKLKPKEFKLYSKDDKNKEDNYISLDEKKKPKPTYTPAKQFAHLHHMKTGGTSIDEIIHCATQRLHQTHHQTVITGSLSECSYGHFQKCMSKDNLRCSESIKKSAVMSFCAPLYSFQKFDWLNADIITVIRDPVERVWSQFRFLTKSCYKCTPLTEIYKMIDNSTINDFICPNENGKPCPSVCVPQLLNHQSRNLILSYLDDQTETMDSEEKLNEAVENLKTKFTVVGITEELESYAKIIGHALPWLNETYQDSEKTCKLGHRNASPKHNYCGERGTNWDLPAHPDEETRQAIIAHNQIDMKLYEAAKKYFAVQKRVYESL